SNWRLTRIPIYDFKSHCRLSQSHTLRPKPIILVDGLWLFRRPAIRRFFGYRIFLDCPLRTRLRRRLARDLRSRGRPRSNVLEEFSRTVQPMHAKYVLPQRRWADVILRGTLGPSEITKLADILRQMLQRNRGNSRNPPLTS